MEGSKVSLCSSILTDAEGVFLEFRGEVGDAGQAVEVSLQDIPANLIVEGETKLGMNLKNRDKKHVFICTLAI